MGKAGRNWRAVKQERFERQLAICTDPDRPRRAQTRAARYATTLAEQLGILARPEGCAWCRRRRTTLERHHWDYTQPLAVTFLCTDCHVVADAMVTAEEAPG